MGQPEIYPKTDRTAEIAESADGTPRQIGFGDLPAPSASNMLGSKDTGKSVPGEEN